jgi:hypothetical protein
MATETLEPPDKTAIKHPEGLLRTGGDRPEVTFEYYVNDQKGYELYWENHDDFPVARSATIIIDFGELRNAFIALDLEGRGGIVDIGWGQTLIGGRVPTLYGVSNRGGFSHRAVRYQIAPGRR